MQDVVGLRRGRTVGALDHQPGPDPVRVAGCDLLLERRRDQDVAVDIPEAVLADWLRARKIQHRALALDMGLQGRQVQPAVLVDRAGMVLHRHHPRARFGKQPRRDAADVAKALHRDPRPLELKPDARRRFLADREHAAPGRLAPAQRTAEVDRLAGDDAGRVLADVHRVGVHHPGHHLFVGVDIGRRDVLGRADDQADLAGVAPGHPLELAARELARIDPDAALGTAKRHVDRRVLDRHPGRQRHHLGQRHILVKTHAALARSARGVVLHPVALEMRDTAVIHLDRHVDDQDALGPGQGLDPAGQIAQIGRDAVDLLQEDAPGTEMIGLQVGGQGVEDLAHGQDPS